MGNFYFRILLIILENSVTVTAVADSSNSIHSWNSVFCKQLPDTFLFRTCATLLSIFFYVNEHTYVHIWFITDTNNPHWRAGLNVQSFQGFPRMRRAFRATSPVKVFSERIPPIAIWPKLANALQNPSPPLSLT